MLAPLFAAGLLLCFAGAFASKEKDEPAICNHPPDLNFNGVNPVKHAAKAGNITVIALLDANCGYCILQATLLRRLKRKLARYDSSRYRLSLVLVGNIYGVPQTGMGLTK